MEVKYSVPDGFDFESASLSPDGRTLIISLSENVKVIQQTLKSLKPILVSVESLDFSSKGFMFYKPSTPEGKNLRSFLQQVKCTPEKYPDFYISFDCAISNVSLKEISKTVEFLVPNKNLRIASLDELRLYYANVINLLWSKRSYKDFLGPRAAAWNRICDINSSEQYFKDLLSSPTPLPLPNGKFTISLENGNYGVIDTQRSYLTPAQSYSIKWPRPIVVFDYD